MLEQATKFILSLLTENEEVKKLPKEFVDASAKWGRAWLLKDDPIVEAVLDCKGNHDLKAKIIRAKLPKLQENERFVWELSERMAAYQRMKNVILNSTVEVKGDAHVGDSGKSKNEDKPNMKNAVIGSDVKMGGDFQIGDQHTTHIDTLHTGSGNIIKGDQHITTHHYYEGTKPGFKTNKANIKATIKALITKDDFEGAINELIDYTEANAPKIYNDALQISGRFYALRNKENRGIISGADAGLEMNRLRNTLVTLLENI